VKFKGQKFGLMGILGLGAGLMYLFDPLVGRRRRALVRDKLTRFRHKASDAIDMTRRDMNNRITGLKARARNLVAAGEPSNEALVQQVHSKIRAWVSHPRSIDINIHDGQVSLSGPILANEVDRLLNGIHAIRGVRAVENRLEVYESVASIPGLQGEAAQRKGGAMPDWMQANWSPTTRVIAGTIGSVLAIRGLNRFNRASGAGMAVVGAGVLARSLYNLEFKRLFGIGAGRDAVKVQKTINVSAPLHKVFAFWSDYQNFPLFMTKVRDVRQTGENRSHWVVAGPAGTPVEWDAVVTQYIPNDCIAWSTTDESPIRHEGIVRFQSNSDGSTRVDLNLSYNPIAGALGHAAAALLGVDAKSEIDADLVRMKTTIETGVPPHDAAWRSSGDAYVH
jgi:uncharacterized membrane protein